METKPMNHTPTPWKLNCDNEILTTNGLIVYISIKANAEFIVTACNAHEDLVKALEIALSELEACRSRERKLCHPQE